MKKLRIVSYPLNCNRPEQFGEGLSFDRSFLSYLRVIRRAPVYIHHTRVYTRTMARSMVRVGVKSDSNYHSAIPRCGVNWLSRAERTESCGGLEHLESSNKRLSGRGEGKGGLRSGSSLRKRPLGRFRRVLISIVVGSVERRWNPLSDMNALSSPRLTLRSPL